jgi:hypothetical protein
VFGRMKAVAVEEDVARGLVRSWFLTMVDARFTRLCEVDISQVFDFQSSRGSERYVRFMSPSN